MEKLYRKRTPKTSPRILFNFGKYRKTVNVWKKLLKIRYYERGLSKTLKRPKKGFFFFTQSLFVDKTMENKRGLELGVSLSFVCKHVEKNSFFSNLTPGQFWCFNTKWFLSYSKKSINTEDLRKMAKFVLRNNFFEINGKVKQKISGMITGMETDFHNTQENAILVWYPYNDG